MLDSLAQLKNKTDFAEVLDSEYYQEHFVKKYIANLPRMALEVFGLTLTYQQIDILEQTEFVGGRLVVPSGHSTGKTKVIGFLSVAFLLLFPKSIVRIIAPTEKQITGFAFKEIGACISGLKKKQKYKGKVFENKWSFLANFFTVNTTLIYINNYKKEWQIHPATAPIGRSENLSGLHNRFLLVIFDEASGIRDDAIDAALGAPSEPVNSAVMFSQHTRSSGRFHNFVTTQNVENGGFWRVVRLNSEKSPRVSSNEIELWRSTYDDNEYNVRVLGLPPLFEDGFLLSAAKVQAAYSKAGKEWLNEIEFHTVAISVDIAFIGIRDSSTILTIRVGSRQSVTGRTKLYLIIEEIQKYNGNNRIKPIQLMGEVEKTMVEKSVAHQDSRFLKVCVDATSGGNEAYEYLEERVLESDLSNAEVTAIRWGSGRLIGSDRLRFINQRAKAYILCRDAFDEGRVYVNCSEHQTRFLQEGSNIPFSLDSKFRYKMLAKKEMAIKGISSPDIFDPIAQIFLLDYYESDNSTDRDNESSEQEYETNIDEEGILLSGDYIDEDVDIDSIIGELIL